MKKELYKGTHKTLYQSDKENILILSFNDQLKLLDEQIIDLSGKGVINNSISSYLMQKLDMVGIENHYVSKLNMREQAVQFVDMFPLQLSISTIACDRYISDFKMQEGYVFDSPIIDFKVKNSDLKYPPINEHQIKSFGWLTKEELKELKKIAIRVYDFLTGIFVGVGIRLVQCNLEFGRVFNGEDYTIMLADELTPDNCKLWSVYDNEKLGLEAFIQNPDLGLQPYQDIFKRFNISSLDL